MSMLVKTDDRFQDGASGCAMTGFGAGADWPLYAAIWVPDAIARASQCYRGYCPRLDIWGRPLVREGGLGPNFLSPVWTRGCEAYGEPIEERATELLPGDEPKHAWERLWYIMQSTLERQLHYSCLRPQCGSNSGSHRAAQPQTCTAVSKWRRFLASASAQPEPLQIDGRRRGLATPPLLIPKS